MQSRLQIIRDTLLTVSDKVFHYEALGITDKYIVWAEDTESSSLQSDNKKTQQAIQGTIDYYTTEEYDKMVDGIQGALNNAEISYRLNSVQYEDETKFIHYEWIFEVV